MNVKIHNLKSARADSNYTLRIPRKNRKRLRDFSFLARQRHFLWKLHSMNHAKYIILLRAK